MAIRRDDEPIVPRRRRRTDPEERRLPHARSTTEPPGDAASVGGHPHPEHPSRSRPQNGPGELDVPNPHRPCLDGHRLIAGAVDSSEGEDVASGRKRRAAHHPVPLELTVRPEARADDSLHLVDVEACTGRFVDVIANSDSIRPVVALFKTLKSNLLPKYRLYEPFKLVN